MYVEDIASHTSIVCWGTLFYSSARQVSHRRRHIWGRSYSVGHNPKKFPVIRAGKWADPSLFIVSGATDRNTRSRGRLIGAKWTTRMPVVPIRRYPDVSLHYLASVRAPSLRTTDAGAAAVADSLWPLPLASPRTCTVDVEDDASGHRGVGVVVSGVRR